jgi:hypothetical protein
MASGWTFLGSEKEIPTDDQMDEHCPYCWDFFRLDLTDARICQCGHGADVHMLGHPHPCAASWRVPYNMERPRQFCDCPFYVAVYDDHELLADLDKILETTQ